MYNRETVQDRDYISVFKASEQPLVGVPLASVVIIRKRIIRPTGLKGLRTRLLGRTQEPELREVQRDRSHRYFSISIPKSTFRLGGVVRVSTRNNDRR